MIQSTMQKILYLILCLTSSLVYGYSENHYQVDLIVFIHQSEINHPSSERLLNSPLVFNHNKSISLNPEIHEDITPYHLRPLRTSSLNNEYYVLKRQPQYQILFHYTWLQPANNQRTVKLPAIPHNGWLVKGGLRIRKSNYYLLDTELYFTSPDKAASFMLKEKQRLKNNTLYYLDHPLAGMLIKIHKPT
ncbi:hypothetical protein E3983_04770 [Legionella israelensis]|uniref:Uncharacterized protein n=2 Tax=Legionella israelensis TaxID=454 RepID=A0A0W0V7D5_9GAMM|nr:CsiV family protein [Legionella israelensis]KTD16027.1 hypothetical protein Lisr_2174 [Legionella israelensis]QBR83727.1 hypothetical protein E3983_04770 [Legionella israelensis]QBS08827.1 hypothetical protein E4T55_02495 [Legionella israelensis]SCY05397.1 Peptidoglycan-binding protein, CsiV [Legionella israelensis DSM 19235]STX58509.1 Protein of uncharacterised function (DUF2803) [Legionella israelensis]